jgi:hypothetical protein
VPVLSVGAAWWVSALRVGLLACRRPDLALVHNHLKYLAFELPSIAIGLPVVAPRT